MIYIILFILLFGIIFFFFSSKVSPIPYFPTQKDDLKKIIEAMDLHSDQIVFDLGAGDGTVIFAAADEAHQKKLTTEFVAVDINILLVFIMGIRKQFHPHKKHIHVLYSDLFQVEYGKLIKQFIGKHPTIEQSVFYIYISPWFTRAVEEMIAAIGVPARIVSYYYPIEGCREKKKIEATNDIYVYDVK